MKYECNGKGWHATIRYNSELCPLCECYTEMADLENGRDEARVELLRLYMGYVRHEGWEHELTSQEAASRALDHLATWGLDPCVDEKKVNSILKQGEK